MLDKLRLILYLILIFIGLIALLYIAPIFLIAVSYTHLTLPTKA